MDNEMSVFHPYRIILCSSELQKTASISSRHAGSTDYRVLPAHHAEMIEESAMHKQNNKDSDKVQKPQQKRYICAWYQ